MSALPARHCIGVGIIFADYAPQALQQSTPLQTCRKAAYEIANPAVLLHVSGVDLMPTDRVTVRLETIRSLNNTQRLLLQAIDDAGDQQRYAGTLIFNSLVFLSDEIKAQIEFLEGALRDWNNECTTSNKDN